LGYYRKGCVFLIAVILFSKICPNSVPLPIQNFMCVCVFDEKLKNILEMQDVRENKSEVWG
jgi:hypothetical protein